MKHYYSQLAYILASAKSRPNLTKIDSNLFSEVKWPDRHRRPNFASVVRFLLFCMSFRFMSNYCHNNRFDLSKRR
jgi:hypothetical protein